MSEQEQQNNSIQTVIDQTQKAVKAISNLIDVEPSNIEVSENAKSQISELEKTTSNLDGSIASSVSALTSNLTELANKALSASVPVTMNTSGKPVPLPGN